MTDQTNVSGPTVREVDISRLANMPITLFSIVMGLTGLAIAWDRLELLPQFSHAVGLVIAMIASGLFVFLTIMFALKIARHPQAVQKELRHPIRINFFPAFSIALLLLSAYWRQNETVTLVLWSAGSMIHILLTLYIMSSWIHHEHYKIQHINPGWFIPVVGNIIVPISGTYLGFQELSWFFFSIGIVFWIILFTVVMYRLIFHDPIPQKITPMLFILLAPPSVGFVSYTLLINGVDNFSRVLFYVAIFIALLLASNAQRYSKLPFFVSSWAYSFPIAALVISMIRFAALTHSAAFSAAAAVLLLLLSVLIFWLVYNTLKAVKHRKICVVED